VLGSLFQDSVIFPCQAAPILPRPKSYLNIWISLELRIRIKLEQSHSDVEVVVPCGQPQRRYAVLVQRVWFNVERFCQQNFDATENNNFLMDLAGFPFK
jgi:hypothetical protein